jgi:hypothetical protein
MPGERQLHLRGEDAHLAALAIVDEHGLGEPEVACDRLPALLWDLGAVEEHPERVAVRAVDRREHAQDMKDRHVRDGRSPGRAHPLRGSSPANPHEGDQVAEQFKRGDKVEWNFRGRTVAGTVRRKLTKRTTIGGQVVAASGDDPRYVVRQRPLRQGDHAPARGAHASRLILD